MHRCVKATGIRQSWIATVKERRIGFKMKPSDSSKAAIIRGSKTHTLNQNKVVGKGHTRGRL